MARTAVIAGTATAVSGGMTRHAQAKAQEDATEIAAQQAAFESQQQLAEMQAQMAAMQAQQAAPPPPPPVAAPAAPAAAPAGGSDLTSKLQELAQLKAQGILTDEEFAAAKAKLLG